MPHTIVPLVALKPELPSMQPVYPDTLIEDSIRVPDTERRIELRWLGPGLKSAWRSLGYRVPDD